MNDMILNTEDIIVNVKAEGSAETKPYRLVGIFVAGTLKREYGAFIPVGTAEEEQESPFLLLRCDKVKDEKTGGAKVSFRTITSPREFEDASAEFHTIATKQEVGFETIQNEDGTTALEVTIKDTDGNFVKGTVLSLFDCIATGFKYVAVLMHMVKADDTVPIELYRYSDDEDGNVYLYNIQSEEEENLATEAFDSLIVDSTNDVDEALIVDSPIN